MKAKTFSLCGVAAALILAGSGCARNQAGAGHQASHAGKQAGNPHAKSKGDVIAPPGKQVPVKEPTGYLQVLFQDDGHSYQHPTEFRVAPTSNGKWGPKIPVETPSPIEKAAGKYNIKFIPGLAEDAPPPTQTGVEVSAGVITTIYVHYP